MSPDINTTDLGSSVRVDVRNEIARIVAAMTHTTGDSEDIITYAKDVVELRYQGLPDRIDLYRLIKAAPSRKAGDLALWLHSNINSTAVKIPLLAGEAQSVERLIAAIEGECEGLAISEEIARAILHYVRTGDSPSDRSDHP